eukprot:CAMPEP_0114522378 /NCGR_PEP_ID=MMETSP0109-20121206/20708_1 /TAXON_ID=29199 /ORGANISM="Chlorarachnion reptans, Strain CCCM449" /LENGTH=894 /DNA_ID=CAMNT_0001703587 /DNA_START=464 /DNA_END=3148 /DNA_ORIENTATION=+
MRNQEGNAPGRSANTTKTGPQPAVVAQPLAGLNSMQGMTSIMTPLMQESIPTHKNASPKSGGGSKQYRRSEATNAMASSSSSGQPASKRRKMEGKKITGSTNEPPVAVPIFQFGRQLVENGRNEKQKGAQSRNMFTDSENRRTHPPGSPSPEQRDVPRIPRAINGGTTSETKNSVETARRGRASGSLSLMDPKETKKTFYENSGAEDPRNEGGTLIQDRNGKHPTTRKIKEQYSGQQRHDKDSTSRQDFEDNSSWQKLLNDDGVKDIKGERKDQSDSKADFAPVQSPPKGNLTLPADEMELNTYEGSNLDGNNTESNIARTENHGTQQIGASYGDPNEEPKKGEGVKVLATARLIKGRFNLNTPMRRWIRCCDCGKWRRESNLVPVESLTHWSCTKSRYRRADQRVACSMPQESFLPNEVVIPEEFVSRFEQVDKEMFYKHLFDFRRSMELPERRYPIVGGSELDLYRLYREVTYIGGFKTCDQLLWDKIYQSLPNYTPMVYDGGFKLKHYYIDFLLEYEARFYTPPPPMPPPPPPPRETSDRYPEGFKLKHYYIDFLLEYEARFYTPPPPMPPPPPPPRETSDRYPEGAQQNSDLVSHPPPPPPTPDGLSEGPNTRMRFEGSADPKADDFKISDETIGDSTSFLKDTEAQEFQEFPGLTPQGESGVAKDDKRPRDHEDQDEGFGYIGNESAQSSQEKKPTVSNETNTIDRVNAVEEDNDASHVDNRATDDTKQNEENGQQEAADGSQAKVEVQKAESLTNANGKSEQMESESLDKDTSDSNHRQNDFSHIEADSDVKLDTSENENKETGNVTEKGIKMGPCKITAGDEDEAISDTHNSKQREDKIAGISNEHHQSLKRGPQRNEGSMDVEDEACAQQQDQQATFGELLCGGLE